MIKANHNKFYRLFYNFYINRELKKYFNEFIFINELPKIDANVGLIVTPNHISWWDGFFIDKIMSKVTKREIYLMMLEKELKKIRFFSKIGAFSISHEEPKKIIESLNYSANIISKDSYLVIYPQGVIEPFEKDNLTLKKGIINIIKKTKFDTDILPVAIKIHYSNKKLPNVYISFGKILKKEDILKNSELFNSSFRQNLELLKNYILKNCSF